MNCAIAQSLEQIGDWWTLLIIRDAFTGATTFSEFQQGLGIAKNILSNRLSMLVENGIMEREQTKPGVERYTYRLTKKGQALTTVVVALMQWGDQWVYEGKGPLRIVDAKDKKAIRPLNLLASDGRPLALADLRFRPRP